MTKIKFFLLLFPFVFLIAIMKNKYLEIYPKNTVNVIVAYKKDGGTDIGTRLLLKEVQKHFPIIFNVKNIPGESGEIGYRAILNAKPDGYTLGIINFPNFLSLVLQNKVEFTKDDMEIIVNHVYDPGVLIVKKDKKWQNLEDFICEAKENPKTITLGNNGIGMSNHLGGMLLENEAKIEITHTPFSSSRDILEALDKEYIDAAIVKISELGEINQNKKFRILVSFTEKRIGIIKDVPTSKESGYDVVFGSTRALVAPKGTPKNIINKLHKIFKQTIYSAENIEDSKKLNINIKYMGAIEMRNHIEEEEEKLKNILLKLN